MTIVIKGKVIWYNKSTKYPGVPGEINGVDLAGKICRKYENRTIIIIENHHGGTLRLADARPATNLSEIFPSLFAK
jgi:hypothetical protein